VKARNAERNLFGIFFCFSFLAFLVIVTRGTTRISKRGT
jgi:hypothetical protein